jgi:threonine synthase
VVGKFVGDDIPPEDLAQMCEEAYSPFAHAAVVPLKQLGANRFLLELFHGPTLAFKDVAMQLLGRLYDYVLERQSRKMTIICATSGDTGGAAVEAFRGRKNARIVALFPEGRISEVQRRFMTTAVDDNVACVSILGSFDDCQAIVKQAFQDDQFRHAVDLSGVNSINWARIAAQSVYYFTAAVALGAPARGGLRGADGQFRRRLRRLRGHQDGPADRPITCATNSNDILARTFEDGRYARARWPPPRARPWTSRSPPISSASISRPSRRDGVETGRAFRAFADTGLLDIPPSAFATMRELFRGPVGQRGRHRQDHAVDPERDRRGHRPAHRRRRGGRQPRALDDPATPVVVLSTAHPAKFPEAVAAACGLTPATPRATPDLSKKPSVRNPAGRAAKR